MKAADPDRVLTLLRALRFSGNDNAGLNRLIHASWRKLLNFTDSHYLTIPLALRHRSLFPPEACERLDRTLERNALCHRRVLSAYGEIAAEFHSRCVDFTVLKGFTQWPRYTDHPVHRAQTDIDIFCPPPSLKAAQAALETLGYQAVDARASRDADHLPVMIRKTGWQWKGDYYDPGRPPSVELHFRLWNDEMEGFAAGDEEGFLRRRKTRDFSGTAATALHPRDGLTYTAMHLVRHLLRGDLQLRHVYELAQFLNRSSEDDGFWAEAAKPEIAESVAFRLAAEWFGCRLHPAAAAIAGALPRRAARWFDLFALSPAAAIVNPNKDELWLHLCLVHDPAMRRRILARRLVPAVRPRAFLNAHVADGSPSLALRRRLYEARFSLRRTLHHLRSAPSLAASALRWWCAAALDSR